MSAHTYGSLNIDDHLNISVGQAPFLLIGTVTPMSAGARQEEAEANSRRLVACWNSLQHISTEQLESGEVSNLSQRLVDAERQRDRSESQVDWLEKANTLHRQVDILYVVDGYEVTVTWDDNPISKAFHGTTVAEAIDKAMAGFDLDAPKPKWLDKDIYGHERQMAALTVQRDELLAALEFMVANIGEPACLETRDGFNQARAAIAKAKAPSWCPPKWKNGAPGEGISIPILLDGSPAAVAAQAEFEAAASGPAIAEMQASGVLLKGGDQ